MNNERKKASNAAYAAIIAAMYVVLTLPFASFAFGPVQFRVAEALCILPFFTPAAIPGLTVGCLLANMMGSGNIWDIVFGSLATYIGAVLSYKLRGKKYLVAIPPILSNTIIIPFVLKFAYGAKEIVPYMMLSIGVGELISVGLLGNILLAAIYPVRDKFFNR